MRKRIVCKWCENVHEKGKRTECPPIFLYRVKRRKKGNYEIVIRGNNLALQWIGNKGQVLVYDGDEI